MIKDILIVRPCQSIDDMSEEDREIMTNLFMKKFKEEYITILILGENKTDQTTFEIIKY